MGRCIAQLCRTPRQPLHERKQGFFVLHGKNLCYRIVPNLYDAHYLWIQLMGPLGKKYRGRAFVFLIDLAADEPLFFKLRQGTGHIAFVDTDKFGQFVLCYARILKKVEDELVLAAVEAKLRKSPVEIQKVVSVSQCNPPISEFHDAFLSLVEDIRTALPQKSSAGAVMLSRYPRDARLDKGVCQG